MQFCVQFQWFYENASSYDLYKNPKYKNHTNHYNETNKAFHYYD